MTKGLIRGAVLFGGAAIAIGPVLAQDLEEYGSMRQRLRIEQNFGTGSNLGLENPSEGRTSLATTRLSYGLETKTRTQELSLAIGGGLRFGSVADGNNLKTGFVDPLIGLRYKREGGNATLSVDADFRETDISLSQPLWTFLDQDGIVRPPRDFSNIRGSGERRSYNFDVALTTGLQDPFGLTLTAGASGTDYINATDASLTDFDTIDLGASTVFRFNNVTTGVVDLRFSNFERQNAENTDRDTTTIEVGLDRDISARSRFSFRVGETKVDTTETDLVTGRRIKSQRSGPSGRLGYYVEMPNGTLDSTLDLTQNQDGQRGTLRFTRALELPLGSLSANIGLTSVDSSDPRVIGGVSWVRDTTDGQFSLQFTRDVFVDSNDEDRFTNLLVAGYDYEINSISSLSADLSLTHSEAAPGSEASKRGSFVLVYNHQLTNDWSLNAGFEFSVLDEEFSGRSESNAVFFGIGRNFDLSN